MNQDLYDRAQKRIEIMNDIDDLKEQLSTLKADDKSAGYTEKAIVAAVKSLRKRPEWHADQLAFELELKTYREAVGLTTDLREAQQLAAEAAETLPEAAEADDGQTTVSLNGGPQVPLSIARQALRQVKAKGGVN
jgi:uncharacterized protein (UPF0335 family)